mmetsp:Transcript_5401/g.14237  ORF Transcript_5401/g.14237 Transcript_5401/m.14237 type:complete len:204 (+) Transcript_5401:637-1248(+)
MRGFRRSLRAPVEPLGVRILPCHLHYDDVPKPLEVLSRQPPPLGVGGRERELGAQCERGCSRSVVVGGGGSAIALHCTDALATVAAAAAATAASTSIAACHQATRCAPLRHRLKRGARGGMGVACGNLGPLAAHCARTLRRHHLRLQCRRSLPALSEPSLLGEDDRSSLGDALMHHSCLGRLTVEAIMESVDARLRCLRVRRR